MLPGGHVGPKPGVVGSRSVVDVARNRDPRGSSLPAPFDPRSAADLASAAGPASTLEPYRNPSPISHTRSQVRIASFHEYVNQLVLAKLAALPHRSPAMPTRRQRPLRAALYARVSTTGQTTENQLVELRAAAERLGWDVAAEYVERGISGAKGRSDRPKLDALLKSVARGEVDVVAAWSVDRLGRSLVDLVALLQELHAVGIDLYLHQQGINTTTPAGKALFGMLGVFAEFEREIIRERINAGIARARSLGTRSGRPIGRPRVADEVEQRIRELRDQGLAMARIAQTAGCGVSTVQRVLSSKP